MVTIQEKAIEQLERISRNLATIGEKEDYTDIAIKALDQEHCEDAVSRKTVLNTLNRMDSVLDEDRTVETYKELLIACYNDLPPVTPVRKEGGFQKAPWSRTKLARTRAAKCITRRSEPTTTRRLESLRNTGIRLDKEERNDSIFNRHGSKENTRCV